MNTVISYASGKPSDPLRGYSYVHDSNFHPNEPSGFRGHKAILNHASALVSVCP